MTDYVDLDELATDDDESADDPSENEGDWLSRANTAPDATSGDPASEARQRPRADAGTGGSDEVVDGVADAADPADARMPHVPNPNKDKPVGIPKEGGGAGGAAAGSESSTTGGKGDTGAAAEAEETAGPHGRGADDMTLAITYEAARALANPSAAFADASRWADWVGVVGGVPAHVLNKFQRDHHLDLDFFNGSGMEPAERLADVDEHSMFYAERMVLVGREDQRGIAERAGWEFLPLSEAAEKADWDRGNE